MEKVNRVRRDRQVDQFYKDLVEKIRDAAEKDIQIMAALRARTDDSRMSGGTPMKMTASCQNSWAS